MIKILAIAVVAIIVVAGAAWYVLAREDEYVPEMTVTLYSRSTKEEIYKAKMEMEVDTKDFVDYFYPATIGTDFPSGDNLLEIVIYELPHINADKYNAETVKILDRNWLIGDLYGKQKSGLQEWVFTIDLPDLKTEQTSEEGAVYLLGIVRYDSQDISWKRWSVNPYDGTVSS